MYRLFEGPNSRENNDPNDRLDDGMRTVRDEQNRKWWRHAIEEEGKDEATIGWRCEEDEKFVADEKVIVHPSDIVFVSAYHIDRAYGGPEEGGWWIDTGDLLECVECHVKESEAVATQLREKYSDHQSDIPISSVLSEGDLSITISNFPGKSYPEGPVHYE